MTWPAPDMCLELVQRDYLGIFDEPMDFSESSLAACLETIIGNLDWDSPDVFFLRGLKNALIEAESPWSLKLSRKKRGPFRSVSEHTATHDRNMEMLYLLADAEKKGWKTEAAVAAIAERYSLKRATVFAAIKSAERFLDSGRDIFPGSENFENPRLTNQIKP